MRGRLRFHFKKQCIHGKKLSEELCSECVEDSRPEPPTPEWQVKTWQQQAAAWEAVFALLKQHNPGFVGRGPTGQEDALLEIQRLQNEKSK